MSWYNNPITQQFMHDGHKGIDFAADLHTPVTAVLPGVVINGTGYFDFGGRVAVSSEWQGQPIICCYDHLDLDQVAIGTQVEIGTQLGLSGGETSGGWHPSQPRFSEGPHIHFQVFHPGWENFDHPIDPNPIIDAVRGHAVQSQPIPQPVQSRGIPYTIRPGDNLWHIIHDHGLTYSSGDLYNKNADILNVEARKYGHSDSRQGNLIFAGCTIYL
jgi:murein DD-endopeptidase MepM/ murein hydrolase activator NlpD